MVSRIEKREVVEMYMNVKKGLDQLYLSQILRIVELVLTIITTLLGALTIGLAFLASGGLASLFAILTGLFAIVLILAMIGDFVLGLLGILNASKDEQLYKNALVWLVIGIVVSLIVSAIGEKSGIWKFLKAVLNAGSSFCNFMVVYSVINATVTVAQAIGNIEVFNLGQQRANSFKTLYIVAIILQFLSFIPFIGGLLSLAGGIILIIIFFQYLGFLGKAKMMV